MAILHTSQKATFRLYEAVHLIYRLRITTRKITVLSQILFQKLQISSSI